jgi:siroheme decarboxylase
MDELDQKIVDLIQTEFPVEVRPYETIGRLVGCGEQEVIDRLAELKKQRIIRRMGGLMEPRKLGYKSALIAARIDPEHLDSAIEKINSYVGVTHNYERTHDFNVWFTLIARDEKTHSRILDEFRALPGVRALHALPAAKMFKLKVNFRAGENDDDQ